MPIIKSAKKRVKTAAKANLRNNRTRRNMREAIKAFNKALQSGKTADIIKSQSQAVSSIDVAAKKNVIHKNKAARQKARLAKQAKSVVRQSSPSSTGVKPVKTSPKKAITKKPTTKKPDTKKPPVNKVPAKKK